jgi:TM2 domain-containing membrane protein YozV
VSSASQPRSPVLAAVFEAVPGVFQVFGLGHIYAGDPFQGFLLMAAYWLMQICNVALCFFCFLGFVTGPLCWVVMMVVSPVWAACSVHDETPRLTV